MAQSDSGVLEEPGIETPISTPKKYRVQLDFAAEDFQEINNLVGKLGLSTRAELFRSSHHASMDVSEKAPRVFRRCNVS